MENEVVSLAAHLTELRKRMIWVLVVLVLSMIGGFFAAKPIILYLVSAEPVASLNIPLNTFSPWDGIRIFMQIAFAVGLVFTFPFALYQLWVFVKPGLTQLEHKSALRYIPGSVLLLLAGSAFGYFVVFPMAFYFTSTVTKSLGLTETYGISQYFTFMFNIVLPMSILFELPILVMFLTKIRILNPMRLKKMRRFAYIILVVIATIVTPPDFISDILVAIPLIILYEASVLLSANIYKKQQEQKRRWEEEYGEGALLASD